ncbi:TlpA family protein disulfide reductase [Mucilaginibacter myungsuensis]|uniref:TlpA family protein disulfide reductase n=1 Tax=Mucilaginibacter myungsuensis TaxID=649104 RepID=A0A929KWI7_9SPHI|nr:TlpA disulfide reductase family protein [Mucilaginibacter myungsuensis]MBE9661982.1 TlpA family protein disulfide reductase [Mucilaginibacter myungsuensis]MDN3599585.1 TlpA disulfide reductase family protein [Mucilaginibacter myungsuensis]
MIRYIVPFAVALFGVTVSNAQTTILEKAIKQINQYQTVSYKQAIVSVGPFDANETKLSIMSDVKQITPGGARLFRMADARGYTNIGNGSTRIDLDLNENTYRVSDKALDEPEGSPYYWAKFMQDKLASAPTKIKQLADTLINASPAYHIQIKLKDTVNARICYDLCLDKKTLLPVYTKQYLHGQFGKGDINSTLLATMATENRYTNYRINAKNFPNLAEYKIPVNFRPEKKVDLLTAGTKLPDWSLQDLEGKTYSEASSKGKVILVDLFFVNCGACALSQPVLAKLHEKYKGSDVEIFSINTSDTKDAVQKYIAKNNIKYPILMKGAGIAKKFQVSAYPTFFVVDKQGKIASVIEGYSDDFEKTVTSQIDRELGR